MDTKGKRKGGFTLIELLIVVAIIGILATIGVPTFRTMVQKSKQSEAKVALGGLYTVETAFMSEYGAYGSQLDRMGFDLEGQAVNRIYFVGFQDTSCAASPLPGATAKPLSTTAQGKAILDAFPDYYTGTASVYAGSRTPTAASCLAATIPDDGSDFVATANGIIAPGALPPTDQWSIDRERKLKNVLNGIKK